MMKTIREVTDWGGRRVLVRASLNVPVEAGSVVSTFRLKKTLKTIEHIRRAGAKVVVLAHMSGKRTASLFPIYEELKKHIPISFVRDVVGGEARRAVETLTPGTVLLLENVRQNGKEEAGDLEFARELAALGERYVVDDFSVLHRKHASVVLLPGMMETVAGFVVEEEVTRLRRARHPKSPSLAIVAGAKFQTKEGLIRNCLPQYDFVFVGGALANDFFKAKGYEVGTSLVSPAPDIRDLLAHPKIILPVDVTVSGPLGVREVAPDSVTPADSILDVGANTITLLAPYIARSKSILWNGPLGNYERGFNVHTETVARLVSESDADACVGGGDSVAAIEKVPIDEKQVFVSTGGGAMIQFLTEGTLPGLEALGYQKETT